MLGTKIGFWFDMVLNTISKYFKQITTDIACFEKKHGRLNLGCFSFSSLPAWLRPSTSKHFATYPTNFELDSSRAYDLDGAISNGPARE